MNDQVAAKILPDVVEVRLARHFNQTLKLLQELKERNSNDSLRTIAITHMESEIEWLADKLGIERNMPD